MFERKGPRESSYKSSGGGLRPKNTVTPKISHRGLNPTKLNLGMGGYSRVGLIDEFSLEIC